ncbi:penicillin-binding protein 1C [Faunimonas sp. B44]|uniref:penicillin-binding protein 1C n=1 Tax=Faunimonas sp. B44 TaxID=3461493 RepID=UPI004044BE3C
MRSPAIGPTILAALTLAAGLAVGAPLMLKAQVASMPLPAVAPAVSTVVLDRSGRLLRPFAVADGRWRLPVEAEDVDPGFVRMLLAYEDRRFERHRGVDLRALARAGWQLATRGRIVSGGSTLTMQVARLLDGGPTRSAAAKLRQIVTALALERRLGKAEVLRLYLTLAPYGGNIEGIRAASLAWLGKEPKRLTPAEAALLVAIPQAPEARRPDRGADAIRAARDRVLARAAALGAIDTGDLATARTEAVPQRRRPFPMLAAHAAERALRERPGEPVHHLTIEAGLQGRLEGLARDRAAALSDRVSVAILAADHRTGEIRASVGSSDLLDLDRGGFLDMTRAVRSPGSALKPLIYGLAFEQGIAHPESLIEDRSTAFAGYVPANFDRTFLGTVTVRRALQLSLNVPAVQLLDAVGPARLAARMRRAGAAPVLSDLSPPGLAIGLGGVGVTLTDLVAIHAAIARGGEAVALRIRPDEDPLPPGRRVLEARAAWQVGSILAGVPQPGGASGAIAFKTGTSYGYRDAWAIGFDGRYVVGVWVGRPDGEPVPGLVGIDAAAPILMDAFARIGQPAPLPAAPPGVLAASSAGLPAPLRRVRVPRGGGPALVQGPQIAYPPAGAEIDLGAGRGAAAPLALKVREGRPPYLWFADGTPIGTSDFGRAVTFTPRERGFVELMVIDGAGAAARSRVFID